MSTQLGSIPAAYAVADNWQVGRIAGRAWIDRLDGGRADLALGMDVEPGVTVFTADHATVTLLRGRETMVIGPKSIVGVSEHPTEGLSTTILERAGSVEFDVDRQNVRHFSVETPMLAAVVKGTRFKVSVNRKDGGVSVSRGTVQVTALASGQSSDVTVGQRARVASRGGLSVNGSGRAAAITLGTPRAPIVSPLGSVLTTGAAVRDFTPAELAVVATVSQNQPAESLAGAIASRAEGPSNAASHGDAAPSGASAGSAPASRPAPSHLASSGGLLAAIAALSSAPSSSSAAAGRPAGAPAASASNGTGAAQNGAAAASPASSASPPASVPGHGHGHGWSFGWGRGELGRIGQWANAVAQQAAASQTPGAHAAQISIGVTSNGQSNGNGPGSNASGSSNQGSPGGGNGGGSRGGGWSGHSGGSRGWGQSGLGLGLGNGRN